MAKVYIYGIHLHIWHSFTSCHILPLFFHHRLVVVSLKMVGIQQQLASSLDPICDEKKQTINHVARTTGNEKVWTVYVGAHIRP